MINCPVCGAPNHHLAVICSSCGGFVQRRVDNLDLFATIWRVVENPKRGFHDIAISRHKNYALFLPAVAGIGLVFILFWYVRAGDRTESLLNILAAGVVAGPCVGITSYFLLGGMLYAFALVLRIRSSFRNSLAVVAYAAVPVVVSTAFVLPIKLLSFGQYLFTSNPSPFVIKPTSYIALLALDGGFAFWSLALLFVGLKVLLNTGWIKALIIASLVLVLYVGIVLGSMNLLSSTLLH